MNHIYMTLNFVLHISYKLSINVLSSYLFPSLRHLYLFIGLVRGNCNIFVLIDLSLFIIVILNNSFNFNL